MEKVIRSFPYILAIIFLVFWIWLAIEPVSRDVWWAENLPVIAVFLFLVFTFPSFRFSNLSYSLMAFWLFWHTVGGHYTFSNVPFEFISNLLGTERNHFDRIGHFSVGFYAYPILEFLFRKKLASFWTAVFFALFAIMALAAAYEIVEWLYADAKGGEAGIAFLGSQGDIWDAQKDMLADTLGAIFAIMLFGFFGLPESKSGGITSLFRRS